MAASLAEIRERDLLSRLAAGTAGVVGAAFLRRLVRELKAALEADVAFVAELVEHRPGYARTIASAYAPGMELREGHEFALAGTPCEHAYQRAEQPPARRSHPGADRKRGGVHPRHRNAHRLPHDAILRGGANPDAIFPVFQEQPERADDHGRQEGDQQAVPGVFEIEQI